VLTGVITPVEALIVATAVLPEDQVPPVTVEEKVVEDVEQITSVPLKVPALGAAVTVTVLVAVAAAHVPEAAIVYVIVALPAATGVTTPVEASIVATAASLVDQVPPVCVEVNVEVPLEHIACVPLKVPAVGQSFNLMFWVHVLVAAAVV